MVGKWGTTGQRGTDSNPPPATSKSDGDVYPLIVTLHMSIACD